VEAESGNTISLITSSTLTPKKEPHASGSRRRVVTILSAILHSVGITATLYRNVGNGLPARSVLSLGRFWHQEYAGPFPGAIANLLVTQLAFFHGMPAALF